MTAPNWLTAIALSLVIGACAAWADAAPEAGGAASLQAAQEDAAALASRDWAGRQVCAGRAFEWVDDKTLVCHRKAQP
ncbi:hypothetical protein [Melaminivora sp.]|uniref:hypothetical protein n=1 Tax=Melaminivora sp. TaxID=1933032 RepID=UPI0028A85BB7|nr:hypothetical protein [Melaminivora sp.]